jgi:hypothetical protein
MAKKHYAHAKKRFNSSNFERKTTRLKLKECPSFERNIRNSDLDKKIIGRHLKVRGTVKLHFKNEK